MKNTNSADRYLLADKMYVQFNVFGAAMLYWISG